MNLQRSWVGNITPRGVTTYQEGEADQAFGAGNAAFMRNWPYAYSKSQTGPVKGKFDVTVLPQHGSNPSVGTVGGWQLGVSSFSKNREAAIELVRYLTSAPVEKFNAIYNSNVPTIPAVARDAAVRKVNPWLKPEIANVARVTRPTDPGHEVRAGLADHLPGPEPDPQRPGRQERPARYRAAAEPPAPIAVAQPNEGGGVSAPTLVVRAETMSTTQTTPMRRPRPPRRRSARLQRKQTRLAWLMLTPALVLVALVAIYPLARTIYDSFTNRQFLEGIEPTEFVGLQNYRDLLHDTIFRDSIVVTVKFTVVTVAFELVLGLIIALVVNSGFKGRGVMRAMMLVPWAIPTVVAAQMWKWMYDDVFGVINDGLIRLHIIDEPVAWISQSSTALASVAAVDIWKTTPFVALLLLAGLQVIPNEVYEAADVDGASKWHQFWRITLPLLVPAILVVLIFRTLDALRVFDVFYVFFGSRLDTQTMAIYTQNTIVATGDVGYGAAMSVAIFLIIGIFVVIYTTFVRVQEQ